MRWKWLIKTALNRYFGPTLCRSLNLTGFSLNQLFPTFSNYPANNATSFEARIAVDCAKLELRISVGVVESGRKGTSDGANQFGTKFTSLHYVMRANHFPPRCGAECNAARERR